MSRKKNSTPCYLLHKRSGTGYAQWTDLAGVRQTQTFPGPHDSRESKQAYARFLAELAASPLKAAGPAAKSICLNEVLLAFVAHGEKTYRDPDGEPTREIEHIKTVCKSLSELYGATPAREFNVLALKALRERFISLDWCRKTINQQVERVRRIFKWAASESLIPYVVFSELGALMGLKNGRTTARETEPVLPVSEEVVELTMPFLSRHVAGLVRLQQLSGCRPGEACRIKRSEIDTSGPVWLYQPVRHKTKHRGKTRTIRIGPRAQEVLRQFFTPNLDDYLFSPARAVQELRAERAGKRKTPLYPSHLKHNAERKKSAPKRTPTAKYGKNAYINALNRGCDAAFPHPVLGKREDETAAAWKSRLTAAQCDELKAWQSKYRWSPNRLRHAFATRVRREDGLEAAQVLLGHSKADITQIYAERDDALAAAVIARIG